MALFHTEKNGLTQRHRGAEVRRERQGKALFSALLRASVPLRQALLLCLLTLLVARPAWAQEGNSIPTRAAMPGLEAHISVEQRPVTVGDPVRMTLEVTHPADTLAIIPGLPAVWGDFEVRDEAAPVVAANPDGTLTTRRTFDVALFAPGSFQTPALPLTVTTVAGDVGAVVAPPVTVAVNSVLTEADTDLRDLKPQADLLLPFSWLRAGALVLALALGVGLLAWLIARRRRDRPDTRTPRQRALDELAGVARTNWIGLHMVQEHYQGISDAVRRYLEGEFAVKVLDRTTAETKSLLRRLPLSPETSRQVVALLGECDLVKFAGVTPPPDDAAAALAAAQTLVTVMAQEKAAADAARAAALAAAMKDQDGRKAAARAG